MSRRGIVPTLLPLLLAALLAGCASNPATRADDLAPAQGNLPAASPTGVEADPAATAASAAIPASSANEIATQASATGTSPADSNQDSSQSALATAASATDPASPPTQAEQDYAAIYGSAQDPYDPVADPTLPTPVELPSSYDPWEPMNRRIHVFNNVVDRAIAKPLAKAYVAVTPRPVRLGVSNFFNNLGQPINIVNAVLQGRPGQAGQSLIRFAVNTTVGLGGVFDPATRMNIPNRSEDFGQTLGAWGWKKSRYVELPLFGPRTVRDVVGLLADAPFAPLLYVQDGSVRIPLQGLHLVDTRAQLMSLDSLREGAADDYALIRDGWLQRRNYQIQQDSGRDREQDDQLPDYLRDDIDNPTAPIPVDVVPNLPTVPGN